MLISVDDLETIPSKMPIKDLFIAVRRRLTKRKSHLILIK